MDFLYVKMSSKDLVPDCSLPQTIHILKCYLNDYNYQIMKIVLITGATCGIGKATAIALAKLGYEIVFIARNAEKAEEVKKEINKLTGKDSASYIQADLRSLDQVRRSAEIFQERYDSLDVLINNAGLIAPSRKITTDGLEETFQVNHLAHFLLTNLLMNKMKDLPDARIINVSSGLYKRGKFDPTNLQGEKYFTPGQAYDNTKLMNILFTFELAERLKGTEITANVLHPGVVRTNFGHEQIGIPRVLIKVFSPLFLSPEKGAKTSIYLASSEEVKNITGKYFEKCRIVEPHNKYLTEENQKILWDISLKLSGLHQ
jgi:NAD(P)-dependent dehydrogenase (short-subunit alcohol dehydrogenase family)